MISVVQQQSHPLPTPDLIRLSARCVENTHRRCIKFHHSQLLSIHGHPLALHLSHQIQSSPATTFLSKFPYHYNTPCSVSSPTTQALSNSLFLTWSICVTPHLLLKQFISTAFSLLSVVLKFQVLSPYSGVSTTTSSCNLLFAFTPNKLQFRHFFKIVTYFSQLIRWKLHVSIYLSIHNMWL